jgi:hypothetical protein
VMRSIWTGCTKDETAFAREPSSVVCSSRLAITSLIGLTKIFLTSGMTCRASDSVTVIGDSSNLRTIRSEASSVSDFPRILGSRYVRGSRLSFIGTGLSEFLGATSYISKSSDFLTLGSGNRIAVGKSS